MLMEKVHNLSQRPGNSIASSQAHVLLWKRTCILGVISRWNAWERRYSV